MNILKKAYNSENRVPEQGMYENIFMRGCDSVGFPPILKRRYTPYNRHDWQLITLISFPYSERFYPSFCSLCSRFQFYTSMYRISQCDCKSKDLYTHPGRMLTIRIY